MIACRIAGNSTALQVLGCHEMVKVGGTRAYMDFRTQ
jgi:hypothetical protein